MAPRERRHVSRGVAVDGFPHWWDINGVCGVGHGA